MQRSRERERNGRIVLRIEVDELDMVRALTAVEALAPGADGKHAIARALERLLADWSATWAERV
jgi:hypothetical protein